MHLNLGKPGYRAVEKMQTVTTLCRFQCGVAKVCALPRAVTLVGCLSSSLC